MTRKDPEAERKYQREYKRRRYNDDSNFKDATRSKRKTREDNPEFRAKAAQTKRERYVYTAEVRAKSHERYLKIKDDPEFKRKRRMGERRFKEKHPEKFKRAQRENRLKRVYGLTQDQLDAMLLRQEDKCAICRAPEPGSKIGWHTDHCHESGYVRGILCHHCNLLLGAAKDNIKTLKASISYLEIAELFK